MKRRVIDRRNKEKFQVDDIYFNGMAKHCGINATGVYMVLCRHSSKEQEAFPSKKLISEKLGISERSVYTALKILEERCVVSIENQGRKKDGSFKVKNYILLDKSEWKYPQATGAVGKKRHSPQANDDISPQATGAEEGNTAEKETQREGNTYNASRAKTSFPEENYVRVLTEYQRLKGVSLKGMEFLPIKKHIKLIFESERSPDDIIRCMKWFAEAADSGDRAVKWTEQWNMNTVRIKLPEFLGGKLDY